MSRTFNVSPSKLSILRECPRCFWDANIAGISRPRGPFPSLPGGIDRVVKKYFDQFRGQLPPEIDGKVEGLLFEDMAKLSRWRNWRSGLSCVIKCEVDGEFVEMKISGAIDDLIVSEGIHMPFDYKTKGSEPETDGREYYQNQLNCYELLLNENGMKTKGKSYLAYFYPVSVQNKDGESVDSLLKRFCGFDFGVKVFELESSVTDAKKMLEYAAKILMSPTRPDPAPGCEYCNFAASSNSFNKK